MRKEKKLKGKWALINGDIYNPYTDETISGNIILNNGIVESVGNDDIGNAKTINCTGKLITAGFIDLHSHFREPGREDKETLETGARAAMAGGFTHVCVMPNTNPPLDTPESIRFIVEKSKDIPIEIMPIGTMTIGQKGEEISEYGEMVAAGAVALSDDGLPVQDGQVMRYALEYSQQYNVPIINHAEDIPIRNDGIMNEGFLSTKLGLTGNPDISETVMVFRDLELAKYVHGRIHIPHVSTKRSVELIREYQKKGVNVTAEVTPHHLGLNEDALESYDTNAKVAPPLRRDEDRMALIEGLKEGVITCIATDHAPHTIEDKEADIKHSPCGIIGLESAFGFSNKVLSEASIDIKDVIKWFTVNPAKVINKIYNPFVVGEKADFTIINTKEEWIFAKEDIYSRSQNSPIVGKKMKSKIIQIISGSYSFGLDI